MTITAVQLFSLPVTDQDRARDFYVGTLGFEFVADTAMGPGQRWVQVRAPGAQTSVTLVTLVSRPRRAVECAVPAPRPGRGIAVRREIRVRLDGGPAGARLAACFATTRPAGLPGHLGC